MSTFVFASGTELHDAVMHGVKMLYEDQRNNTALKNMVLMIILLTDGEPNTCMYMHVPTTLYFAWYSLRIIEVSLKIHTGNSPSVISIILLKNTDENEKDLAQEQT